MLFEDSLEFEPDFSINNAELIPTKNWHDIKFSDLWIPSELLYNRLLPYKPNLDTYAFYHTLEKPSPVDDTFSVYFESNNVDASTSQQICSSTEELLDSLDEVPTNECHNGNILNSYYTELGTTNKSPARSTVDLLEYLNFSDSETEDNHGNISDNTLEKLLSEVDENTSNSNKKDDSDQFLKDTEENNFDKTIYNASEDLISNLDANNSNSRQVDYTDQVFNETQVNYDKIIDHVSENLSSNVYEDDSNQVVNFPDIYLKPKDDFSEVPLKSKKKSKKEKKQNKIQKNIPLDNFFLGKQDAAYSEHEKDEFYENIMRRTYGSDYLVDEAKQTENALPTISSHKATNYTQETLFQSSKLVSNNGIKTYNNLNGTCDQHQRNSRKMQQRNALYFENEMNQRNAPLENEINLIIENIPPSIDEEGLKSLISQYGDIKQLLLRKSGRSLKAELSIELDDPVWIVECLNGTYPFGASGGEELKCYLKN